MCMWYVNKFSFKQTQSPFLHTDVFATTNGDFIKRCAPTVRCSENAKYRTFNGSCNNLERPTWGAANTPFLRLLNAEYSDGITYIEITLRMQIVFNFNNNNYSILLSVSNLENQ